jgi:hydroxyacylglutathione hydrolase
MMEIVQIPALNDNYIYVIADTDTCECAVVDPAVVEPVWEVIREKGWVLTSILNTHHHFDHTDGNAELKARSDCDIVAFQGDMHRIENVDTPVKEWDIVKVGQFEAQIIEVPGHTDGHIAFWFDQENALFCGDTLFAFGAGRIFEGSMKRMWESLGKIKKLPGDTRVYCAHEYTVSNADFALQLEPENQDIAFRSKYVRHLRSEHKPTVPSLLSDELKTNPFLRTDQISLQKAVNTQGKPEHETFETVRILKNNF